MCEKKQGEAWYSYVIRMVNQKPLTALGLSGWVVAAVFCWMAYTMYSDYKASNERQTAAYMEVTQLMGEVRTEMRATREHLHQLDTWHKQEYIHSHEKQN